MILKFKDSPKHKVTKLIAWLCSFGYIFVISDVLVLLFSGFITRLYNFFKDGLNFSILNTFDVVLFDILILVVVFLLFCLNFFEWVLNPVFEVKDKELVFKSDTVIAVMREATTTYTIRHIKSYKKKKNSIIVYGVVNIKEPLGKNIKKSSCEISCLYDEEDMSKVLESIKRFMNEK